MGLIDDIEQSDAKKSIDFLRNQAIDNILLSSGRFYQHMDRSVCCKKCNLTLKEGCQHAKVSVCFR